MPLIKLPPLKLFGKKSASDSQAGGGAGAPNTFLALMFVNNRVQAALWQVSGEKIETLTQSSLKSFENDEDGLIQADQALQDLGAGSEAINEVVFGFDPLWVDDAGLLADKKPFIKKLTENLGLKPVGFVVITDALVQQIVTKDRLASEVLVYVQESTVYLFLLKQGKLVEQLSVGRSEDMVQDIVEGLARFASQLKGKDAFLPAKLILASAVLTPSEMDDAQQQIVEYDWSENHPFVQAPVVESMAALDVLYCVVEQGGGAVAQAKGLRGAHDTPMKDTADEQTAADFGFENVDERAGKAEGDNFTAPSEQVTSFGVPIAAKELPDEPEPVAPRHTPRVGKKFFMPAFLTQIGRWYQHHPHKNIILAGMGGGLLALIVTLGIWSARAYQVVISVQLAEKVITKDVAITIDPSVARSNPERQILKASIETTPVSGQDSVDTTGVKLVGDKAKGTVIILNKTKAVKTFAAGTQVTAGQLAFVLDSEVTVASASDEGTSLKYAEQDAAVTANAIGADSNIAKDTALTIANFSTDTYSAKAKDALTGGSSREVRVVAAEDRGNVLKLLRDKLVADAAAKFKEKSGNGTYYIPTAVVRVTSEQYDAAAGEEADKVTLDLALDVSGVVYKSEDLRPLLTEALKTDIPEGYQLIDEEPQVLSDVTEASNSTRVVLDANVTAKARPPFDPAATINSILGLSLKQLDSTLAERAEIEQAKHLVRPGIAKLFVRTVPSAADRVSVEVTNQTP